MAALFLVAGSLFALRYGLSKRLDLKQPLASMLPESFSGGKSTEHAKNSRPNPKRNPEVPYDSGATGDQDRNDPGQQDSSQSLDTANEPDPESNITAPSKSGDGKSGGDSDEPSGEQGDNKASQPQNQPNSKQDSSNAG